MHNSFQITLLFSRVLEVLNRSDLTIREMRGRKNSVKNIKSYTLAYTNLKTKLITIDIYTAKKREPKKIAALLKILAHEIAHHQKPPFRQRYKGHIITRRHFPVFYRQVKRNINKLKKDKVLKKYFIRGC